MNTIKKLRNNIVTIEFADTKEMMNAVYRFSHHHEYDEWRNKEFFYKEELDEKYEKEHGDKDWWKKQWAGANLTVDDIHYFLDTDHDPQFDEYENIIVDAVRDLKGPYAIAIWSRATKLVQDHELAHCLFYLDEKYRTKVSKIVSDNIKELDSLKSALSVMYDDTVMLDELHVYAGIYYKYWAYPKSIKIDRSIRRPLEQVFEKAKKRILK